MCDLDATNISSLGMKWKTQAFVSIANPETPMNRLHGCTGASKPCWVSFKLNLTKLFGT